MRFFSFLLALAATATARRVVSVDISKATPEQKGLDRRAFSATLVNNRTAYFARVTVGTPPQPLTLHVDTGSSDLWVLAEGSDLCNSFRLQQEWGYCFDTFDPEQSSTFETVGRGDFAIRYVDGTGSSGDYFTDNVGLGDGVTITNLQMGLAHEATSNWGMLGIGYTAAVAAAEPYPNIIDLLLEQGQIPIKAYSLYLNDASAQSGTILFGGIDTEKFIGELQSIDVIPNNQTGLYDHFTVALTSVTATSDSGITNLLASDSSPIEIILDSGTTLTYLPESMTAPLFRLVDAFDDTDGFTATGLVYADCALRSRTDLFLTYQFGGPTGPVINVSAAEMIMDDLKPYIFSGGLILPSDIPWPNDRVCRMGVMTADHEPPYLVGDTFLRSAYVVYDLTNNVIAMAQSNVNATSSRVIEIPTNGTVPLVTGVATPASQQTGSDEENAAAGAVRPGLNWEVLGVAGMAGVFTLCGMGLFGL
ncbi:putative aspartic-type endopeptidase opsB [Madurella mycetomatis]|uniref:Aspartic-type endopeptidase opsB n=1 Tax=Madurella mycetomatis TaxID=100816 RepID=A0A175W436_9PEZI|nr:putative aspartic-type endopeptidase opsB [Madurella mycetomatis]